MTVSRSGDFRLVRPLVYVSKEVTRGYVEDAGIPVTPCVCSYKTGTVREKLRGFLAELKLANPHVAENLLTAMGNIDVDRLLDRRLQAAIPVRAPVLESDTMLYSLSQGASASSTAELAQCKETEFPG